MNTLQKPIKKALVKFLVDSQSMEFSRAVIMKANRKGRKITFSVEFEQLTQSITAYGLIKQFTEKELEGKMLYQGSSFVDDSQISELRKLVVVGSQ